MRQVVCKTSDVNPGEMQEARFGELPIVLCRTLEGKFYAFSNRCLHQGASLADGMLCGAPVPTDTPGEYRYEREGQILRCPWHGREFDVVNGGQMLADPARCLPRFQIEIEDDRVVVVR
ncbi:Rieske (2Fe-2S) protein [Alicyclobacillus sp. SO9]|uniref:Rieske (2Fe-2S) protein n=1 Tax=Alicyclobacillus sp. SO9 TaxID=2665646 RepID=UPI0018E7EC51|nr:Rieske (2Fe-2S) protein [Alicyclobacillus sp. SO9]QQE77224.1 Rieske (2Fe-2S) protein [Alicyclobacillus sp. SO9]